MEIGLLNILLMLFAVFASYIFGYIAGRQDGRDYERFVWLESLKEMNKRFNEKLKEIKNKK
jgi:hypothetical protein